MARSERLLDQQRVLLAMGELTRAIAEDSRCGAAYLALARLRAGLGDYAEADVLYARAIHLRPVADEALRARALMRRQQGKMVDALRDMAVYAELAPNDVSRLETLATVYIEIKAWAAALATYRRITRLHELQANSDEAASARIKVRALSLLAADADPVRLGASEDHGWTRRALARLGGS